MSAGNSNLSFFIPDDENDIQDSSVIQGITTKASSIDREHYTCYVFGPKDFDEIQNVDFYLNGIIGFPLGLLGILNNLIFVGVLTRTSLRRSIFNKLLISFAILNVLSLLSWIIHISYKTFHIYTPAYILLFPQFLYPFRSIFLSATVFMTVALVHERWWIAAHPNQPSHRHRFAIYIATITLAAIIINMPRFFEMMRVPTTLGHDLIKPSALRTNPNYSIFYICWTRLILLKIIPNIVLIILCYKMYLIVKTTPSETCSEQTESEFSVDHERRLSIIFISIVYAFFVCHIPANFLNMHEAATINKLTFCLQRRSNGLPPWILILHDISNFFLYLYPCFNLWFIFGPKQGYREEYLAFICRKIQPAKGKSRLDGEEQIDDERRIMDHELTDFDLDRSRNSL